MPGVETGKCEWQLMGHDGNYLDELPRKFGMLPLTQASRVEILLRCTEVGTYSWESIKFGSTEYICSAALPLMNRGDAAAATRIVRGDKSRRRRGRDADIQWRPTSGTA